MINRGLPSTCVLSKFHLCRICSSTDFYSISPAIVPTKKLKPEEFCLLLAQQFKLKTTEEYTGSNKDGEFLRRAKIVSRRVFMRAQTI